MTHSDLGPNPPEPAPKRRRHWKVWGGVGLAILIIAGGTTYWASQTAMRAREPMMRALAGSILDEVLPRGECEFVAEVAPREKDILLPKKHPSAFFGTPLASYLIEAGADTLVVTGCTTSGCVRGSVVDAFAYNFRVLVPQDAVYDRSATSHAVNLFDMASKYADVMPTDDALTALRTIA